jgi:hypothetical protein
VPHLWTFLLYSPLVIAPSWFVLVVFLTFVAQIKILRLLLLNVNFHSPDVLGLSYQIPVDNKGNTNKHIPIEN